MKIICKASFTTPHTHTVSLCKIFFIIYNQYNKVLNHVNNQVHLLAKNLTYMYVFSGCCIHSWSKKLLKNQHKQRNRLFINYCNKQ